MAPTHDNTTAARSRLKTSDGFIDKSARLGFLDFSKIGPKQMTYASCAHVPHCVKKAQPILEYPCRTITLLSCISANTPARIILALW